MKIGHLASASAARLTACAATFVVAVLGFAQLAAGLSADSPQTRLDLQLALALESQATASSLGLAQVVSFLHRPVMLLLALGLAALWLRRRRGRWPAPSWLLVLPLGLLLNPLVKHVFHRARPTFDHPLVHLHSYSFPSGHVEGSTVWYGLLLATVWSTTRNPFARWAAASAAPLLVALVAWSRMVLGAHYLSDVMAGACEGVAWLALWVAFAPVERAV